MINKLLHQIVNNFGFKCVSDFGNSIVHSKFLVLTLPLAALSSMVQTLLGLHVLTIISFVVLVVLELITGLLASKVRGEKIVSRKFSRFGLKVFVWILLLYVTNAVKLEYNTDPTAFGKVASTLFTWLHGTFFIYIVLEYLISVLENLGVITGNSKQTLIDAIIKKINTFLGLEKDKDKK